MTLLAKIIPSAARLGAASRQGGRIGLRGLAVEAQYWLGQQPRLLAPHCRGLSSPGNAAVSQEMSEEVAPDEVRRNEEATQRHLFSEKERFRSERYGNPERADSPFGKAFAEAGDTGPERAVTEAMGEMAPGQSLGINIIPEKLAHAKPDENVPEAPPHTPGAKPSEVPPDNRACEMGPGAGATRASWDAQRRHDGGTPGARRPEEAGAEGEPEDIMDELHKGDEWAS